MAVTRGYMKTHKSRIALVVAVSLVILSLFFASTGNLFAKRSPPWLYQSEGTINSISITQTGDHIALGIGFNGTRGAVIMLDGSGNVIWEHQTDRIIRHVSVSLNGSHIEADGYQLLGRGGACGYGCFQFYANSEMYSFDSNGKLLWSRTLPDAPSSFVVMSADGSRIAISSPNSVAYLTWGGKTLWNYSISRSFVAITQNGSRIAISGFNNVTMLASDGKQLWTFRQTALAPGEYVFTRSGDLIAAGDAGSVYLLTGQGAVVWRQYIESSVQSAGILPNGSTVAYATNDKVLFYNRGGALLASHETTGESTLLPTSSGLFLLSGAFGGGRNVMLFDASGKLLWNYSLEGVLAEAVSGDGAFAAASSGVTGQGGTENPSTLYFFGITGNQVTI
jgi:hypothetical protein